MDVVINKTYFSFLVKKFSLHQIVFKGNIS